MRLDSRWALALIVALPACAASPENVAQQFLDAISEGDRAKAESTLCFKGGFDLLGIDAFGSAEITDVREETLHDEPVIIAIFTYTQSGIELGPGRMVITENPLKLMKAQQKVAVDLGLPPVDITSEMFGEKRPCVISVKELSSDQD